MPDRHVPSAPLVSVPWRGIRRSHRCAVTTIPLPFSSSCKTETVPIRHRVPTTHSPPRETPILPSVCTDVTALAPPDPSGCILDPSMHSLTHCGGGGGAGGYWHLPGYSRESDSPALSGWQTIDNGQLHMERQALVTGNSPQDTGAQVCAARQGCVALQMVSGVKALSRLCPMEGAGGGHIQLTASCDSIGPGGCRRWAPVSTLRSRGVGSPLREDRTVYERCLYPKFILSPGRCLGG